MTAKRDETHVALLRGINVGGKNRLPMKELRELFEQEGTTAVRTYIQSGNVVFETRAERIPTLPERISEAIAAAHGLVVPIVLRSAKELAEIAESNSFLAEGVDPQHLHVAFLSRNPDPERAATLDPDRSPPDRFVLRGRELYLACPNGLARTKLTNAYLDSRLGITSTVRNWRTVGKLLALCEA